MDWKSINTSFVHPARELYGQGRKKEAFALLDEGLKTQNQDGYIALTLAELLENEGMDEEAKRYYNIAVQKLPMQKWKNQAREGLERLKRKHPHQIEDKNIIVHGDLIIGGKTIISDSVLNRSQIIGSNKVDGSKSATCRNCGNKLNPKDDHCSTCGTIR